MKGLPIPDDGCDSGPEYVPDLYKWFQMITFKSSLIQVLFCTRGIACNFLKDMRELMI